jgi:hypothetical protein
LVEDLAWGILTTRAKEHIYLFGEVGDTLWLGGSLGFELRVAKSHAAVMQLWADTGEAFVPEEESGLCPVFKLYSGICLTTVEKSRQNPSQGG